MIIAMQMAWHHMPALEKLRLLVGPRALALIVAAAISGAFAGGALRATQPSPMLAQHTTTRPDVQRFDVDRQDMVIPSCPALHRERVTHQWITRIQTPPFPNACHLCGCCQWPPPRDGVYPGLKAPTLHIHVHPL